MNNEPVAWMDYLEHSDVYDLNVSGRGIPLYTHPAKTLTDEEIAELAEEHLKAFTENGCCYASYEGEIEFARAILRKASEK